MLSAFLNQFFSAIISAKRIEQRGSEVKKMRRSEDEKGEPVF